MFQQEKETRALFISYAPADRAWVHGYLIPALGLPTDQLLTPQDFRPGAPVIEEFEQAVTDSRYTVLVLSPAYIADEWTQFGGTLAAHISVQEQQNRLIPLLLDDIRVSLQIRSRVPLDCRVEADWEHEIQKLRELLRRPAPSAEDILCPYPGMVPFKEDDARFFYGRKDEVNTLLDRLRHIRQIFIIGPSGSGKSSLVFASLVPELRTAAQAWQIEMLALDQQPTLALTRLLQAAPAQRIVVSSAPTTHETAQPRLLIVIDQFERLFTLADLPEQSRFLEMLRPQHVPDNVRIVCTLRADFYDALMSSVLWPLAASQRFEVTPLQGTALREAIERPALEVGVHLSDDLVVALLKDAMGQSGSLPLTHETMQSRNARQRVPYSSYGSLPLIQETMQSLWDKRRHRLLTLQAYQDMSQGGRSGLEIAIETKADAALMDLDNEQQEIARRILLCLVHSSEGCPDVRRQRARDEIRNLINDDHSFDVTLEHLIQNRILTISHDDMVEIAHDVLLRGWPQLQRWLEQGRADRLLHNDLEEAAARWHAEGRDHSFLIGGSQLAKAQQYVQRTTDSVSPTLRDFLSDSAAREAVRERSRYLGQAAGGALGAALGYGLAFTVVLWFSPTFDPEIRGYLVLLSLFQFTFPIGLMLGLSIGLVLWLFRYDVRQRIVATGLIGAVMGGVTFVLAIQLITPYREPIGLQHLAAGALLGMGVGIGAGLPYAHKRRLLGSTLGGTLAASLALAFDLLAWPWLATIPAGLILGGLTGLGLQVTAVEQNEYVTV